MIDDYHGRRISDPYRWLEDAAAEETRRFVEEENAYTRSVLERCPGRDELRRRIEQLLTIGRVASPGPVATGISMSAAMAGRTRPWSMCAMAAKAQTAR